MRVMRRRLQATQDEGFSLVETIVALTIAVVAFSTLSLALISGAHASLLSQQNQQAGDLLSQVVEQSRALGYDSLAMRATDLDVGETRSPALSTCACYAPTTDSTSGAGVEPLAPQDPAGGIAQHVQSFLQNGLTYKVRRYVTQPTDAFGATYKRLTIYVSWSSLGKAHTRSYSTIVTAAKRGLPLPDYKFTTTGSGVSQCRNPGSTAIYSFVLKNNGARDAWNLAVTGGGSWSFFADSNANGAYDASDASLNVSGAPTTGLLEPTGSSSFFAVASVPSSGTVPYTWATTFRATSAAQPGYFTDLTTSTLVQSGACGAVPAPTSTATATASPSATPTPTATAAPPAQPPASCASLTSPVNGSAPSGTMVRYYLENPGTDVSTNASSDMGVHKDSGVVPPTISLYAFSQDTAPGVAGRYLGSSSAPTDTATWIYQMPANSVVKGNGTVTLWARVASGSTTAAPALSIKLDLLNSDGTTKTASFASATYTTPSSGWGCAGFRPFSVQLGDWNGNGEPVAGNEKLRLSVKVTNAVPVVLAYDTSSYPSEFQLPIGTGVG